MHANAGASRLSAGPVHTTCAASIAEQGSSSVPPALLKRSLQDMPPAKRASPPRRTMGRRKSVLRSNTSEQPPPPGDGSTLPAGHNELDQIVLTPSAMPPARRARTKPPNFDLWCRTFGSVVPGRSRSTSATNDCSSKNSGSVCEEQSRPARSDFLLTSYAREYL